MRPEGQIESISCDKNIFDKFRASPIKIFSTNFVHRQKKYFRQISRIAKKNIFDKTLPRSDGDNYFVSRQQIRVARF
jgi:hypothetical protein